MSAKKKKIKIWIIAATAAGAIFSVLLFLFLGIYRFGFDNRFFSFVENIVPFPAVYAQSAGIISIRDVKNNNAAIKKFYESQEFEKMGLRVDFSTDQGKKRMRVKEKEIINKMLENMIVEDLARERGIVLSENAIASEIENSVNQFGDMENLLSDLARLYGWTIRDFQEKVVKPELYAEKLSEVYAKEIDNSSQIAKIHTLRDRVVSKKEEFTLVAQDASEGQSAQSGGDLGWSTRNQLIDELAEKAFSMRTGEISGVVESPLGFHILKLEEKKNENQEELVHLRQLFVKKTTFGDWLKDKMKKYSIFVFLKDYSWNPTTATIDFTNTEMQKFEQALPANSEGDPSVF